MDKTPESIAKILKTAEERPKAEIVNRGTEARGGHGFCSFCGESACVGANFCIICGATFLTAEQIAKGELNS